MKSHGVSEVQHSENMPKSKKFMVASPLRSVAGSPLSQLLTILTRSAKSHVPSPPYEDGEVILT